ncbi:hypothetical protein LINGRAHAP2_LOCUS31439 [Linum grandiflorum]
MNGAMRSLRNGHQLIRDVVSGGSIRRRVNTLSSDPGSKHNVEKAELPNPKDNKGSPISNSGGEGYATRSDEAGFGTGEYGGNAEDNVKFDQQFNQDHPAYDKSQGKEASIKDKSADNHTNTHR